MLKGILVLTLTVFLISCNDSLKVSDHQSISNAVWNKDEPVKFTFQDLDTIQKHNLFINVRNDDDFEYSNLFLIASLYFPDGKIQTDTLEYEMALPDGTWLGKGSGSLKENKLWYKENIVFPTSGVYTLEVSHAMRKNGNVSGVAKLSGVHDVGLEIVKSNK